MSQAPNLHFARHFLMTINKAINFSLLIGICTVILANAWNHVVVDKCCTNIIIMIVTVIRDNFHSMFLFLI